MPPATCTSRTPTGIAWRCCSRSAPSRPRRGDPQLHGWLGRCIRHGLDSVVYSGGRLTQLGLPLAQLNGTELVGLASSAERSGEVLRVEADGLSVLLLDWHHVQVSAASSLSPSLRVGDEKTV